MLGYNATMAKRVPEPTDDDLIPEGPELDALIKAKVAEADANPVPGIAKTEVFDGLRTQDTERLMHSG